MFALDFKMTPREALKKQAEHVEHYGFMYPGGEEALRAKVASMTNVDGLDMTVEYDIGTVINKRIPRGADIEHLCGLPDQGGN